MAVEAPERQTAEEAEREQDAATNGSGPVDHDGGREPLDGEEADEQAPPVIPPLVIEGDGQLTLSVGGEKPTMATIKLRGGKIEVPSGDLDKGQVVDLVVKAQVAEVHFADTRDGQTGEVTSTDRRHILKPISVERIH